MKKPRDRYIKHVETIPADEFKKLKVFQSMIGAFKDHSDTKGHDHEMQMVVVTNDGDTKTLPMEDLVCSKDDWFNAFSDGRAFCAVKILWSDGKWEYGLKLWENTERICRKNGLLVPMYTKVGEVDENGVIVDTLSQDGSCRIPAWILNLIPMWNERRREALNRDDPTIETKTISLQDWRDVQGAICSEYTTDHAHLKDINMGGKKVKMPVNIVFDRNKYWRPVLTEWKENVCREEFGSFCDMLEAECMKVVCYSYLKSIYCNKVKRVKEYKVVPLSDVIMLTKRRWNSDAHEYVEDEVWNSLDETCKGNV